MVSFIDSVSGPVKRERFFVRNSDGTKTEIGRSFFHLYRSRYVYLGTVQLSDNDVRHYLKPRF